MVDYSKWNTMEFSSSDDEDGPPSPKVTKLDADRSRVTFGGGKKEIKFEKTQQSENSIPQSYSTQHGGEKTSSAVLTTDYSSSADKKKIEAVWTSNGAKVLLRGH